MSNYPDDIRSYDNDPRSPFCDDGDYECPECRMTEDDCTCCPECGESEYKCECEVTE